MPLSQPPQRRGSRGIASRPPVSVSKPRRKYRRTAVPLSPPLAVVRRRKVVGWLHAPAGSQLRGKAKRRRVPGSGLTATPLAPKRKVCKSLKLPPAKGKRRHGRVPMPGLTAIPQAPKRRQTRSWIHSVPPAAAKGRRRHGRVPGSGLTAIPRVPEHRIIEGWRRQPPFAAMRAHKHRGKIPPTGLTAIPLAPKRRVVEGWKRTPPGPLLRGRSKRSGSGISGSRVVPFVPYVSPVVHGPFEVVAMQVSFAGAEMGDVVESVGSLTIAPPDLIRNRRRAARAMPPTVVPHRRTRGMRGLIPCR